MVRHLLWVCAIRGLFAGSCPGEVAPISVETPYNHITIERFGSVVEMRSLLRAKIFRESAVDLTNPSQLIVPYTAFVAASAVFHPRPKNVLMIGMGGGGFNQFFVKAFPAASLETVELDPQVLAVAQQYMGFKPSSRDKVTIQDGRMFLRRSKAVYEWIILDAFRGGFVPPHLKTAEFYKLAQARLAPDGIFIANVRTDSALFAADLRTMQTVFPQVGYYDVQTALAQKTVHWESVGNVYTWPAGRLALSLFVSRLQNSFASKSVTLSTGKSSEPRFWLGL